MSDEAKIGGMDQHIPVPREADWALEHEAPEGLPSDVEVVVHEAATTVAGAVLAREAMDANAVVAESNEADRSNEVFKLRRNSETFEVEVESDLTLEDYRSITEPKVWSLLETWAESMQGKSVVFVNPTMEGGGVAMLRPTVVHMMKLLGIDARWYVMQKPPEDEPASRNPFLFTKLMHNVSQRMSRSRIGKHLQGKANHQRWALEENWPVLSQQEPIQNADFMIFDDPQPAPLIEKFRALNPTAKIGWRNHIDTDNELMDDPSTPQGEVANYLLYGCGVAGVDFAVHHPNPRFVHKPLKHKSYFAPATIDSFDNLNRHLSDAEVVSGIEFINNEIAQKNSEHISNGREEDVQPLLSLDPNKKRITLVARFDESKGMDKAIALGVRTRRQIRGILQKRGLTDDEIEKELPEVVIVGNGSVDDPSGPKMYRKMLRIRRQKRYADERHGVTIMRLKHNYDAINALMSRSSILMQTSDAEGLETRISDGIMHGLPVVISNRGAMYTQIPEAKRGNSRASCIIDYDKPDHDIQKGVDYMVNLLTNDQEYEAAHQEALENASYNRREFSTVANVIRFLRIFNHQLTGKQADEEWLVGDMADRLVRETEQHLQQQALGEAALA